MKGMLGEVCVTNRGRFRKPHVQREAWMLLTSVGSNSGPFVPRMRRNRKGGGCCTDLKSIFLACWGLSRGAVLALRSVQSLSSTCDQPEVPEPPWGQSTRAAGRGGGSLIFITWMLECEDKDLNWASKRLLLWQCCLPQSLPSHPFAGISGDWSGNSLSWSRVSSNAGAEAVTVWGWCRATLLDLWIPAGCTCSDSGWWLAWIDSYSPTWLFKGKPESIML